MKTWICPNCKKENQDHWLACLNCENWHRACPNCEKKLIWGDKFLTVNHNGYSVQADICMGNYCSDCGPVLGETFTSVLEKIKNITREQIDSEKQKAMKLLYGRRHGLISGLILFAVLSIILFVSLYFAVPGFFDLDLKQSIFAAVFIGFILWITIYFGLEYHAEWPKRISCIAFYLNKGIENDGENSDVGGGAVRYINIVYQTPDGIFRLTRLVNHKEWKKADPDWKITLMVHSDKPRNWIFIDSAEGGLYRK